MVRTMSYSSQPSHSATSSVASSTASSSIFFLPQYMNVPEPEYISLAGAISTVENYLPPENVIARDVTITPAGLRTVNLFLDYILHEVLARTQSTALFRLREGVALVLRTTLGTSAMANGEQELMDHLYIGETEEDKSDDGNDSEVIWDLERVWARARIICMVYSILGDKEQDDFEEEKEEEEEEEDGPTQQLSTAASIYLAAVLETVANHCLRVAARTAYNRISSSKRESRIESKHLIVEDADVKRGVVEDELTTRLWRKWKRSENLLSTMLPPSHSYAENHHNSDKITQRSFTPAQAAKELNRTDKRRNSGASPDVSRENHDSRSQSRALSPTRPLVHGKLSSAERRQRHRRSRESGDSQIMHYNDSVADIKETLGERGVKLPASPHSSRFDDLVSEATSSTESKRPHSRGNSEISSGSESRPVSSRGKEFVNGEITDALATPRNATYLVDDDPLKTPTPHNTAQFFNDCQTVKENDVSQKANDDDDFYVIGGDGGFDSSFWETKAPENEKFFYSPPVPKVGSIKSASSYEIIPSEEHVAVTAHVETITEDLSDAESNTAVPRESVDADPATSVEIPQVQVLREDDPAVIKPPSSSGSDVIPGSSSKGEEKQTSILQELPANVDDPDDSAEHVNDRIANQFAELERDQAAVGLGLGDITSNGMSSVTITNITRGPIIVNHTELTPIMEAASPRESMASELGEPVVTPRLVHLPADVHSSPPPTRQSQSSNRGPTSPVSPAVSVHSTEKARTSSLTSQAERLRSKFLNRKHSPERDLTVETDATSSEKLERRMKFESLIRSGETMKMTLTPTSLRSIEDDNGGGEQRTIPARVRQQARENSTRELSDFLRSTGPESFLGGTTYERRGSLPAGHNNRTPPQQAIRSMPSTPIMKHPKSTNTPPVPSTRFVPRSPVGTDPEHSTLQLAAFLRTTGPNESPVAPITLGDRNISEKAAANSIHSNGDSSTSGLLKYQSLQSQRYPPSPSTSTAYGTLMDDDDSDDLELSMYPGARRKQKTMPREESLVDFLRNTGPPEPNLPPSPTTPKNVRDKFTGGNMKKSRSNVKSPEPQMSRSNVKSPEPQSRAVDIFEAAPSRVMSPTPGPATIRANHLQSSASFNQLNVNLPSSSLMGSEDYFNEKTQASRSNVSVNRLTDSDEIQTIRKIPSRTLTNGVGPREPVVVRSVTTDSLAEFLRNTGPGDFGGQSPPKAIKKSKSGFFKRLLGGNSDKGARIQRSGSTSGRFTPITIPAMASS